MLSIAVIGGTGFGSALVVGTPETVETEYGPASLTRAVLRGDLTLLFLARHGAGHSLPPHRINHKANIAALRDLGVDAVFATTAVGSLRPDIKPGDFVVLDDFLDFTKGDPVTFFSEPGQVRHTDFVHPYDPGLRYAGVALATNYGTGLVPNAPLSHAEVEQEMAASRDALAAWLLRAAEAVK